MWMVPMSNSSRIAQPSRCHIQDEFSNAESHLSRLQPRSDAMAAEVRRSDPAPVKLVFQCDVRFGLVDRPLRRSRVSGSKLGPAERSCDHGLP